MGMVQPFLVVRFSSRIILDYDMPIHTVISHWFPLITRCPVNGLPDVLYVYLSFNTFEELYAVRRKLFKKFFWKKTFMEDLAVDILREFPDAYRVHIKLLTNRHQVVLRRDK
uniref:Archeaosine synthase n=1 Tax=Siphoviridae sp. ctJ7x27 TaxID=2827835 RepID=A0A8S5S4R5_9CAUD|nr:MAG TPA: archeaosine synthase [Siphoviridae sp. ctJ7x27]